MPAPLAVDKEAVRVLVVNYGAREAARRMRLNENTVLGWSKDGQWLKDAKVLASAITGSPSPARDAISATLPQSLRPVLPEGHAITPIKPSDAQREAMSEDSQACRVATLRIGRRTLEATAELAEKEPLKAMVMAPDVKSMVGAVSVAGEWQQAASSPGVVVNIAVMSNPE